MTNNLPQKNQQGIGKFAQISLLIFTLLPTWGGIGILIASFIIFQQNFSEITQNKINWALAALSVWLIVTCCLANQPGEAFLGLANFFPFMIIFAALTTLIRTINQLRWLAWLLVSPSLIVAILGLGQLFLGWSGGELLLPVFGWILVPEGNPEGRMSSVFMYANILAAYELIIVSLGLGLWLDLWRSWRKNRQQKLSWLFWFLSITLIADTIALILTNSRSAWGIGILIGVAFTLYLGWYLLVLGVAAAAGAIAWASFGPKWGQGSLRKVVPAYFWLRLSDQMFSDRPIETLRLTQWQFTIKMTQSRPWLGWGLRNFTLLYEQEMDVWLGHPHNLWLMLAAETGIPGIMLLSAIVAWILAQATIFWQTLSTESGEFSNSKSSFANIPEIFLKTTTTDLFADKIIIFSYLVAFTSCILFNLFDVSIFDLRINLLGWILLAAIWGVTNNYRPEANFQLKLNK
ncbi:MAG: O-antigen ligase family protein [Oscillatoria sp. PMC 1068.18]|nr:O-antigen ligase family protein [Oscillatoria sp. PMC 1076.18]MEC4988094.1 O-antigen ligase family protein [Oscillatoria sp. PMC 1068.18]